MASFLESTTYEIKSEKAFSLFAESATIDVICEGKNASFKSFGIVSLNNRNVFELTLIIDTKSTNIHNPVFIFDETQNTFSITYNNDTFTFTFYTKEKMNLCTIKNLNLNCSCN